MDIIHTKQHAESTREKLARYREACAHIQHLDLRDEKRVLEVKILVLEGDASGDAQQLKELNGKYHGIERELSASRKDLALVQRKAEGLHMELSELNKTADEANKILAEKLALSRQVATLQTRLDSHIHDQKQYTDLLSEKLAVDRQLHALRAELNDERARAKASGADESKIASMAKQIEALKTRLADQQAWTDKAVTETENVKEKLVKQSGFTEKAKSDLVKQSKEVDKAKADLVRAKEMHAKKESALEVKLAAKPKTKREAKPAEPARRTALDVGPTPPKPKPKAAAPEKSAFSTTPFFNRQSSVLPASPSQEQSRTSSQKRKVVTDVSLLEEPPHDTEQIVIAPKKKKRKLGGGGRTLFDDMPPPAANPQFQSISPAKKRDVLSAVKGAFTFNKINIV